MSRLDSMLRRFTAQRDGLNWAAERVKQIHGEALDMGLGNGRTYDHMREIMPERRIWVMDRVLQCHHSCIPPEQDFLLGEAEESLCKLAADNAEIVLSHYDFGFGVKEKDVEEAARFSPLIAKVMTKGGVIVSGQPLVGFKALQGPDHIAPDRYYFYET
jgi:hypothetical protein